MEINRKACLLRTGINQNLVSYLHEMKIIETKVLTDDQFAQVNQLWNEEYPVQLMNRFPILLDGVVDYHHYLIADEHGNIIAWAVAFYKDNQMRFSLVVASKHQGKGLGTLLINQLKISQAEFYGWVIDHDEDLKANGENYTSPLPFYLQHGFEPLPDQRIDTAMIRAVLVKWKNKN